MKPKRLISLLVAVCMMITMLPLSAVTAFATDTSTVHEANDDEGIYRYAYKKNEDGETVTITKFLGPVDPTNNGPYVITIPTTLDKYTVTGIGKWAFDRCGLHTLTIEGPIESMGLAAFYECTKLETISFGENIKTIGEQAFQGCSSLTKVTIPDSVTSIGEEAFYECTKLETISFGENIETIGRWAFTGCSALTNVTIPKNVTTIESGTFKKCSKLEYIILPAGLTSFKDSLTGCPAGNPNGAIYYKNYKAAADALLADNDNNSNIDANDKLKNRNFLYLCKVTFDANGGDQTDYPEMSVYKTKKINANDLAAIKAPTRAGYNFTGWYTDTDGKQLFNADETAITDDITLHAGWKFDPDALDCHQLTVTGGTVTVKYDGSDVTSKLNSRTDATTGKKTYYVPDGATVTVTLDKTAVPNGKVFDGWSTSLPTGQDYKAESITFRMSSGVDIAAQYRDAAADHTHDTDTAVCHPLTVTGGIVTVKKGDKDVTDTLTVTTDEATGKKTYSVPEGATVTVTLDKTLIPEGMVFDIWSTGKFSLPLGQDYKAESITFTMNTMSSDVVDIAAQYRDATIEDDGPNVLGTAAIIGTAAVGTAVLGYQAYSLGTEFAGKLMALPYFPSNRSALAMMLWEDAGKPMPESELLYPDVEQEEQDMDLQHAARWAMENELIPDLNDEGTAPEEMKFFPANPVSKLDVLNAWQKAQELKNN
ncbi:MAG: leucine-rich repeat protein [Faecalibacterium sp.]